MSLSSKCILTLALLLALTAGSAAQAPAPLCCGTVQAVTAEPVGFDQLRRPVFAVTVDLAAHGQCGVGDALVVRIRDASNLPPYHPNAPECTWTYRGEASGPVTFKLRLPVPLYFRGPICVDVFMCKPERFAVIMGPMMLPEHGLGLQPFGRVDTDRNRLHLRATYVYVSQAIYPRPIQLTVEGALPGAAAVIALSPCCNPTEFMLGGRLLIGSSPIVPIALTVADKQGRFSAVVRIPYDVWQARIPVYVQAACDSFDDSLEPWLFSGGVKAERDTD